MSLYLSLSPKLIELAKKIKLLIMDVDGVLSDGKVYFTSSKQETKSFYVRDGLGIVFLHQSGIKTAIITGRDDECVALRAQQLKINHYYAGIINKTVCFRELIEETRIKPEECAYIADDIIDLPLLQQVGLSVAVADAHESIKNEVDYITTKAGGMGAVREICDIILYAQNHYHLLVNRFSK